MDHGYWETWQGIAFRGWILLLGHSVCGQAQWTPSPSWTSLPAVQIGKVSDCWFCSWTMRGNGEEWEEGGRRGWMTTSTLNFGWDFQNEPEVHRPKCFHRRNGSESGRRQIGWGPHWCRAMCAVGWSGGEKSSIVSPTSLAEHLEVESFLKTIMTH